MTEGADFLRVTGGKIHPLVLRGDKKILCLTKQVKCFSICSMPLPIVFMFECIMNTKCIMNTECIIRLNM